VVRVTQSALIRRHAFLLALPLLGLLISSCGSSAQSLVLAKAAVDDFHSQLDTEQYATIYQSTDDGFRKITNEPDFTKLLQSVHRKLGNVQEASTSGTGVAWFLGQGATVTLVYNTRFHDGTGTERFIYHVRDNHATLYGYRIFSNDLIEK